MLWSCGVGAAVFVVSYLNGWVSFGSNQWASAKLLGGLLLLSYTAAGATIALYAGTDGIRRMALTMVVACCTIIGIDTVLSFGFELPRLDGFTGNTNAFAFQIIICFVVGITMLRDHRALPIAAAILVFGALQTGSRAGAGTMGIVMLVALLFYPRSWRTIAFAAIASVGTSFLISSIGPIRLGSVSDLLTTITPWRPSSETAASDSERWRTLTDAFNIFLSRPFLGSGLGYYFEHFKRPDGGPLVILTLGA
jgi:hypothetical protein